MTNIIVVFPKIDDAKSIKNLLVRNGFSVTGICTTGNQAVSLIDGLNDGIVICGYKFADMLYTQLDELLPTGFEMLLMTSRHNMEQCLENGIVCLDMPLKVPDLINTVGMMVENIERRKRKRKNKPKERSGEERNCIDEAKKLLMFRNNMTEDEAHRYLQKCSMDSGCGLTEMAAMVLTLMKE